MPLHPHMLPGWLTHAASLCVGAAAGVLVQSYRTSRDQMPDGCKIDGALPQPVRPDGASNSMPMLPKLPIRLFQPNDDLVIAFDTRNKVGLTNLFSV